MPQLWGSPLPSQGPNTVLSAQLHSQHPPASLHLQPGRVADSPLARAHCPPGAGASRRPPGPAPEQRPGWKQAGSTPGPKQLCLSRTQLRVGLALAATRALAGLLHPCAMSVCCFQDELPRHAQGPCTAHSGLLQCTPLRPQSAEPAEPC